ncbi:MAG: hypothetical protein AAGG07_06820 [Planctomycetota bacterium]
MIGEAYKPHEPPDHGSQVRVSQRGVLLILLLAQVVQVLSIPLVSVLSVGLVFMLWTSMELVIALGVLVFASRSDDRPWWSVPGVTVVASLLLLWSGFLFWTHTLGDPAVLSDGSWVLLSAPLMLLMLFALPTHVRQFAPVDDRRTLDWLRWLGPFVALVPSLGLLAAFPGMLFAIMIPFSVCVVLCAVSRGFVLWVLARLLDSAAPQYDPA